jgi:DNA-nicking Smr family endonuclease
MGKTPDQFNPAFQGLDRKLKIAKNREDNVKKEMAPVPFQGDDDALFQDAMAGVTPLNSDRERIERQPGIHIKPSHPAPDDERDGLAHLQGLVHGTVQFDITFSDEYIEGSVKGFRRKMMRKLKRGEFSVQDYVDLHGLNRSDAEIRVREFLLNSHVRGLRCVLIVHGRGLNSPDSFPVLKEELPIWLNRGPIRKIVLAFSTALPHDGGTGAVYVLLRK